MQCMKLKTQWSNTQPKNCTKTALILKNPKVNQKSQKLGQKHEMHDRMSEKYHTRCKKNDL